MCIRDRSYTLPRLPTNGSETNFAAVFELLGKTMKADIANLEREFGLVKRPTVFFITDGYPQQGGKRQELAPWGEALKSVHAITTRRDLGSVGTAVIAFGFGDADCENLKRIAKAPGRALRAEIGVARTSELMTEILQSIMESIQASVRRGDDLVFNPVSYTHLDVYKRQVAVNLAVELALLGREVLLLSLIHI